ncbi:oxidoreductase short-chain dehydrogenase reductase family protein [Rutstroemia sp. NJR-2017a BVV2]|nr:oxidoreductase short-chain dehydrogenase reductase family protein [Rutstroemia sp. NJR-2017a BVV2]
MLPQPGYETPLLIERVGWQRHWKELSVLLCTGRCGRCNVCGHQRESAQDSAVESKKYASNPDYRAVAIHVDVTNETSVQAMVETAIREFGRIDYNVNSAGIGTSTMNGIAEIPIDELDNILNVHMKGTMLCTRAVSKARLLQEPSEFQGRYSTRSLGRGSIVNLGSLNSYVVAPGKTSYTTLRLNMR